MSKSIISYKTFEELKQNIKTKGNALYELFEGILKYRKEILKWQSDFSEYENVNTLNWILKIDVNDSEMRSDEIKMLFEVEGYDFDWKWFFEFECEKMI